MRYGWMIIICFGWLLAGCQSEKEETAAPETPVAEQQASPAAVPAESAGVENEASSATGMAGAVAGAGDAAKGKAKAGRCKSCHSFAADGGHQAGPNLFAVFGRPAGTVEGFRFSSGLKGAGFNWDAASLAAWVCDSKVAIKALTGNASARTSMPKQRVCGADAANMVAYLESLK